MKQLVSYIGCILTALFVAVYIDGSGGVMITVILVIAILFSKGILLFERDKIKYSLNCSDTFAVKGNEIVVDVKFEKKSILPTPFIEMEIESSDQLSTVSASVIRFTIATTKPEHIKIKFQANFSGLAYVKVKRLEFVDYLGVFRQKIIGANDGLTQCQIRIMPNIPDVVVQAEILKTTAETASFDDNEEETSEVAIGSTGTPGYDHRSYVPGDSLKKINWKISSKRDIYMVRLDDKIASSTQCFVIDCPKYDNMTFLDYKHLDNIIEGCLAMLAMLVSQGLEGYVYYYVEKWHCINVRNYADLLELQEKLSWFIPVTPHERIPAQAFSKGGSGIVCFTFVDQMHMDYVGDVFSYSDVMFVVYENSGLYAISSNMWTCSQDFEFKRIV